jgi:hypothetical protein
VKVLVDQAARPPGAELSQPMRRIVVLTLSPL